jgi:hypothetical protein
MKPITVLVAALCLTAPAFAHDDDYDRGDDEDSWQQPQDDYNSQQDYGYQQVDQYGPSLDDFRNDSEMSWNGEWIDTPEYGTVWRPTRVSSDWQPYLYGRWAWTRAGWAWVSEEPFGWAVYHYGRWAWSPAGWFWVPGRVWAPAWVAWRSGDGYAGWCPLGPRGIVWERPAQWVYVGQRHFLEPVRHHVIPRQDRGRYNAPPPRIGPRAGPPVASIERATGRTVTPLPVTDATTPRSMHAGPSGLGFYRPRTQALPAPQGGPRPAVQGAAQAAPRPVQGGPRAAPPRPNYSGGVPAQSQGGPPRPHAAPGVQNPPTPAAGAVPASGPAPHAAPSKSGQETTHAKER